MGDDLLKEIRADIRAVLMTQAEHGVKLDHVSERLEKGDGRMEKHNTRLVKLEQHKFTSLGLGLAATSLAGILLAYERIREMLG